MKKRLLLVVLLGLVISAATSFASGPAVLATGTATLANTKLSLATNYGFFDFGVDLTAFVGEQIEICAATAPKYCIRGVISTVGTGETLGSETLNNPSFNTSTNGWITYLSTIASVAGGYSNNCLEITGGNTASAYTSSDISVEIGGLIKVTGYVKDGSIPSQTYVVKVDGFGGDSDIRKSTGITTSSWAPINTLYGTRINVGGSLFARRDTGGSGTVLYDELSVKQVLTPSATGHWIKSASGAVDGVAWSYKHASFNPNDSAGYTYRILSTNIPGKQIASGTVSATDVKLATVDGGAMVEITGVDLSPYAGVDAYSPPSTNLQLHLKADAGCYTDAGKTTACASDADKVYVWEDQSGNGNDAVQATEGYRPLWKTNIVGTLPAIRFDGSNDHIMTGNIGLGAMTIYMVGKPIVITDDKILIEHSPDLNSNDGFFMVAISGTAGYSLRVKRGANNSGRYVSPFFTDTANSQIWSITYNGTHASTNPFSRNGRRLNAATQTYSSDPGTSIVTDIISLGARSGGGVAWNGDIYEILIYNTAHDDITRTQIERYLAGKWGISYTPTVYGTSPAKYLLCLYDSSSRVACGYVGAAGGGETLGAEIATGTLTAGKLYKITATEANHFYTGCAIGEYFTSVGTETCDANNKVQEVTEIAATGVHGHSTVNATDRKMSLKTTGFDPNAVTSYKIYRTY